MAPSLPSDGYRGWRASEDLEEEKKKSGREMGHKVRKMMGGSCGKEAQEVKLQTDGLKKNNTSE